MLATIFESIDLCGEFLPFGRQAPLDLLDVLSGNELLRNESTVYKKLANLLIVLDVLIGDSGLGAQIMFLDVEVGNFVGEMKNVYNRIGGPGVTYSSKGSRSGPVLIPSASSFARCSETS